MTTPSTVVIGAGPYGLSIAAHLRAAGRLAAVIGDPMSFWQRMPGGMLLKSPWTASSLSDPAGRYSIDEYARTTGRPFAEPIPLQMFLEYGRWFAEHAVGEVDRATVSLVARDPGGFRTELTDGRTIRTDSVVVATGIERFPNVPDFAHDLPAELCSHAVAFRDASVYRGAEVVVVGAGQSALEYSALLHEAGAHVELVSRGPVRWGARRLYDSPARRVLYPRTDVGPIGLNWVVSFPMAVRHIPPTLRWRLRDRSVRPQGAKWLRSRVDGVVRTTEHTQITEARERSGRLQLTLSDGSSRCVDHLMLGTGYRPQVASLDFLETSMRASIATDERRYPLLDQWLQSTVPNLHFAGALAAGSFGPLCGFVAGTAVAARQVARHAVATS